MFFELGVSLFPVYGYEEDGEGREEDAGGLRGADQLTQETLQHPLLA